MPPKKPTPKRPRKPRHKPLAEPERRRILEEIARNPSNRSAQIQALRFLKELDDGEQPPAESETDLYNVTPIKRSA